MPITDERDLKQRIIIQQHIQQQLVRKEEEKYQHSGESVVLFTPNSRTGVRSIELEYTLIIIFVCWPKK